MVRSCIRLLTHLAEFQPVQRLNVLMELTALANTAKAHARITAVFRGGFRR
jgi:hypothetical protein